EKAAMNASHTLTVPSGKTLIISGGDNIINIGSNTLSINGGGTVTVNNTYNGFYRSDSNMTPVLNLENITVNLESTTGNSINVNTVNVNSGATVNLNSATGGGLIRIGDGWTLTVNTGGVINILDFYGVGINNSGTVHINGGTVSVGAGTADNWGISNSSTASFLKITSGTLTGTDGGAIYLSGKFDTYMSGSKVEGANGIFADRGVTLTNNGQIEVGIASDPASANGLTEGMYFWNGSTFERLANPVEITSIVLNITAPVAGATESTPTTGGAGYAWSSYDYTTTSDGASFPIGSTFAANTDYTITVVLFSLTGYQFGTIPTANVTGTNGVVQSATVNGGYLTVVVNYPAGFGTITGTMTVGGTIVSDLTQSAGGTGWMWTAPSATLILDNAYTGEPIAVNCQNYTDNIKLVYSGDVSVGSPSSSVIFCNGNLEISENGTGGVLTLTSTSANALHCAIEVNGSLAITGGMVNTEAAGSGTSPNAAVIYGKMGVSIDGSASVTANATGSDASGICVESGDITISTTGTLTANGNGAGGALAIRNGHKLNMSSGNLVLTGVPMYSEQFVDVIIGGGSSITIDGTAVYLAKLTLGGVSTETEVTEITSPASGYGVSSKFTDASGKLCFFLPAGNGLTVTLTAGGTTYSGTVTVATDHSTVATLNEFVPSPTYGVSIATFNNGRVTSAQANYMENDNVALTLSDITAGYELTSITVHKTGDGNTIVPLSGSGKSNGAIYTFGMPAYGVTVTATFDKIQVKRIELLLTGTLTLRIRNTGNVATGELSLALSGVNADAFTLPFATLGNLSVGDETDITLTPRADLTAGTYTATLTVSGAGLMSVSQEITYTVIPTGIESPQSKSLKVSIQNGILHLSGLTQGKPWSIYNISGIQVYQNIAKSDEEYITLPVRGAYIVKSGKDTIKVIY
ncbi:MAG: hypothetical protein LBL58_01820, partial [Tannerellaceae bacterium]|nr:hypothetical protein [Tannerellaceae bacterium]